MDRGDYGKSAELLKERLLVLMFMSGDLAAYEALFHAYHLRVLRFVRKLIKDGDLAEDVTQEAWMAIYKSRGKLRKPDLFRSWIFSVARNLAYQHLREVFKQPAFEALTDDHEAPIQESKEQLEDELDRLYFALDRIAPAHREVLVLKYLEGLSYEEIAEVVSENIGTVRSRLFYAKKAIGTILEKLRKMNFREKTDERKAELESERGTEAPSSTNRLDSTGWRDAARGLMR